MKEKSNPASVEMILGSLLVDELNRMEEKIEFYGFPFEIITPDGKSWVGNKGLTLYKFLKQHPVPEKPEQLPLYGLAWEFVWGVTTPQEIIDAKKNLIIRNRCGLPITQIEETWLKVDATTDTDMF